MGWATAAPYIATGIGALGQGLMGHGGADAPSGYPKSGDYLREDLLDPLNVYAPNVLGKALSNIEHLGGVAVSRAQDPVMLAGTEVQQPGWYGGAADDTWQGGMAMPVGLSGVDQAWMRPSLQGRPGIRFGGPDPTVLAAGGKPPADQQLKYMFAGAPRFAPQDEAYFEEQGSSMPAMEALRQPPQTPIKPGAGVEGIYAAMKLLGVERDPMGNLAQGTDWPTFTGALPYRRRTTGGSGGNGSSDYGGGPPGTIIS